MEKIRKIGAGFLTLGLILGIGSFVLVRAGIGPSALFILVAPSMATIGLVMVVAPGDAHGHHDIDFADWFEGLPAGRRVALYLLAAAGLGAGVIMILYFANWSLEGVLDLVL